MRWYFYAANPPWNNTRYSAEAVRQTQAEFLVKLRNVYAFFVIYANIDRFHPGTTPRRDVADRALLDRWILSELNLANREITAFMDEYRLYESAQRLIRLTDALSNWYVRRSRSRFWAPATAKASDKWDAFHTLHEVLTTVSRLAAPFIPFFTEVLHQNLVRRVDPDAPLSVHLSDWPDVDEAAIDEGLSEAMGAVRDIVSLGLQTRATQQIKVRQPLSLAEVIVGQPGLAEQVEPYADLIAEELNVKSVRFVEEAGDRVSFAVKPNYRALGPIFGKRMPVVRAALDGADADAIRTALVQAGEVRITLADGEEVTLSAEHIQVAVEAREGYAASGGTIGVVVLNTALDDELISEGLAREVMSRIQALRKDQDLEYTARIQVHVDGAQAIQDGCIKGACFQVDAVLAHAFFCLGQLQAVQAPGRVGPSLLVLHFQPLADHVVPAQLHGTAHILDGHKIGGHVAGAQTQGKRQKQGGFHVALPGGRNP
jgi:isoleucyl-tRNA synthetase